jgi:hypothetical protein
VNGSVEAKEKEGDKSLNTVGRRNNCLSIGKNHRTRRAFPDANKARRERQLLNGCGVVERLIWQAQWLIRVEHATFLGN